MHATWRLASPPPTGAAAIAVVQLCGDIDAVLAALDIRPVPVGGVALRSLAGIDEGVVMRPSAQTVFLTPHAGPAVLLMLAAAFARAGIVSHHETDPRADYPEASSLIEARMLATLAIAHSPLAIDLLLDQPRRWAAAGGDTSAAATDPEVLARSAVLNRLVHPPLVIALGRPNIGKSTLLNALAGRSLAITADEPGTTRDHVGAVLDLGGLVVRYIDAPGLEDAAESPFSDPIQQQAQAIALEAAARADLVLLCADPTAAYPAVSADVAAKTLRLTLRSDLGPSPRPHDLALSLRPKPAEAGLRHLVALVRERLVPAAAWEHPGPWLFWDPEHTSAPPPTLAGT